MITTLIAIVNTLVSTGTDEDYPANYKITDKAHVYVYYIADSDTAEDLLTQVESFSGTPLGEYKVTDITETGFNIVLGGAYTAATGRKISIRRVVPFTQEVNYPPGNDFPGATHERALDKLTAIVQEFNENISRQIGLPLSEDAEDLSLPSYISNYYLGLDGDNNLIWKAGTGSPGNDEIKDSHIDWGTGANQVSAVDMPIADVGGIITATEVEGALQENRTALDVEEVVGVLNTLSAKGMNQIVLTNYTSEDLPAIAANSVCEINGALYTNPSEVAISGSTANTTWYDILLTPSGTTFTASFIARNTGAWSDSKQGLYSGNNRVVACAYRDSSDSDWINKNILIVNNRTVKLKMEIGSWNMSSGGNASPSTITHGVDPLSIRNIRALIRRDGTDDTVALVPLDFASAADVVSGSIRLSITDNNNFWVNRFSTGYFYNTNYDDTAINRGWITIEYVL